MRSAPLPTFDDATVTAVAKAIGGLYSGTEITGLLAAVKLTDVEGEGTTKWKRLHNAVANHQSKHSSGNTTVPVCHNVVARPLYVTNHDQR